MISEVAKDFETRIYTSLKTVVFVFNWRALAWLRQCIRDAAKIRANTWCTLTYDRKVVFAYVAMPQDRKWNLFHPTISFFTGSPNKKITVCDFYWYTKTLIQKLIIKMTVATRFNIQDICGQWYPRTVVQKPIHRTDSVKRSDHGLINYIDTRANYRHLEKLTCKGTLRQVLICLRPPLFLWPHTPLLYSVHTCIMYTYSHMGGELTREKVRGATNMTDCISSLRTPMNTCRKSHLQLNFF